MSLCAAGIHLLTLSDEFDEKVVDYWIERIPSRRLPAITRIQMSRILGGADREAGVPLAPRSALGWLA